MKDFWKDCAVGFGEDPWWKEPDPPEEGCESSWHCGGWGK